MAAQPAAFQLDGGDPRLGNTTQGMALSDPLGNIALLLLLSY